MIDDNQGPTEKNTDAQYREGMVHLQAGHWQQAIQCLEEAARKSPDDQAIQAALDTARFKASVDTASRVKAKRWSTSPRAILVRVVVVLAAVAAALFGARSLYQQVAPSLAFTAEQRQLDRMEADARTLLEAGDLAGAQARFERLLAEAPEHAGAQRGLEDVEEERDVQQFYTEALALQQTGDLEAALQRLTDISLRRPQYKDVSLRIEEVKRQQKRDVLFAQAEEDYAAGKAEAALLAYRQLHDLEANYKGDLIANRMFELNMSLGDDLIRQQPPAVENVSLALDYYVEALSLQPRSSQAALEQELARHFLEGNTSYHAGRWNEAVSHLEAVYNQRPDYLHGTTADLLYEAYVRSGDQYRDNDDVYLAYERYTDASDLPVADKALAEGRIFYVIPFLTPTTTPTITPIPSPTQTATPIPTPGPVPTEPTATPVPLTAYRDRILFYTDDEESPGLWVMDADGSNREYLGDTRYYREEYRKLRDQELYSPDHRYQLFVQDSFPAAQVYIAQPRHDKYGDLPPMQLTHQTGLSYDPVWSPDGSRIAFVSQEGGGDDIWVILADGTQLQKLTQNTWPWDKHPSWSPDSSQIVFWSNRDGIKRIFIMDAGGQNVRNLSDSQWDEYDPLWVK